MFTVAVQGILNYKEQPIGPAGMLYGEKAKAGDDIYVIAPKGICHKTKIYEILKPKRKEGEATVNEFDKVTEAEPGELVVFKIDEEVAKKTSQGMVVSNVEPTKLDNIKGFITNPRLKGLLRERDTNRIPNIFGYIAEEVAMQAPFLAVAQFSIPPEMMDEYGKAKITKDTIINVATLTDGEGNQYIPVFTEPNEVILWKERPADSTVVYSFDKLAEIADNKTGPQGFVINPFTDNLLFGKELIEKMKEKRKEDLKERKLDEIIAKNRQV